VHERVHVRACVHDAARAEGGLDMHQSLSGDMLVDIYARTGGMTPPPCHMWVRPNQPSNTNDTPTPTLPPRHRRNPPEQRSKHGARRPMTYTLQQNRTLLRRSTAVSGVPLRRATAACNYGLRTPQNHAHAPRRRPPPRRRSPPRRRPPLVLCLLGLLATRCRRANCCESCCALGLGRAAARRPAQPHTRGCARVGEGGARPAERVCVAGGGA
jgi:hypothetical protein